MKHTYQISGMTCDGCRSHVEKTLSDVSGVTNVSVSLAEKSASIEMESHIPLESFKTALEKDGGTYGIGMLNDKMEVKSKPKNPSTADKNAKFYCPMHCEGDKMYDKPGD